MIHAMKQLFIFSFFVINSAVMAQGDFDSGGGAGGSPSSNLLNNGDFESSNFDFDRDTEIITEAPSVGGFERVDYFASATDWSGGDGVYRFVSDGQGNSAIALGTGIGQSIFQDFSVTEDGDYDIGWSSFIEAPTGEGDPNAVGYSISLVNQATSQSIFAQSYVENFDNAVSSLSASVNLSGPNVNSALRLTISRTGSEKAVFFTDDVSVEAATVPEPSSVVLGGLASLLLLRRRR